MPIRKSASATSVGSTELYACSVVSLLNKQERCSEFFLYLFRAVISTAIEFGPVGAYEPSMLNRLVGHPGSGESENPLIPQNVDKYRQNFFETKEAMYVFMGFIGLVTALVVCARSQDSLLLVSVHRVHVVFSTAGFTVGGKEALQRGVCVRAWLVCCL